MAAMEWTDKLALGLEPMDKTHVEFVDAYNRLLNVSGAELLAAMDAFIEHSVEHFEQENAWMAKIGFPGCHKAEHDRVLAVCRDVRKRMEHKTADLCLFLSGSFDGFDPFDSCGEPGIHCAKGLAHACGYGLQILQILPHGKNIGDCKEQRCDHQRWVN